MNNKFMGLLLVLCFSVIPTVSLSMTDSMEESTDYVDDSMFNRLNEQYLEDKDEYDFDTLLEYDEEMMPKSLTEEEEEELPTEGMVIEEEEMMPEDEEDLMD